MDSIPDSFTLSFADDGNDIVFAELHDTLKLDLALAKQLVMQRVAFAGHKKHFLVADVSNVREMTPEAKDFLRHEDGGLKNILGAAFIASNPVSALIANIFVKAPKAFEAKFFSSRENAVVWIKSYKEKIHDKLNS